MDPFKPLIVDAAAGTHLGYLDSGKPADIDSYTTLFMIHGFATTAKIFSRVVHLAPKHGFRIVSISRRDYPGSSPLTSEESSLMLGNDEDKAQYLADRGLEFLKLIDTFIQEHNLPPPAFSAEGKYTAGGVAIAGWSLGNAFSLAAVASIPKLQPDVQARVKKYLRSVIFEDPPIVALGFPLPPKSWNPALDPQIPEHERVRFQVAWLTSYFDHRNLTRRNLDELTYALPSARRAPSIYNMKDHLDELVCFSPVLTGEEGKSAPGSDTLFLRHLGAQLRENYEKVTFGEEMKKLLPNVMLWYFGRAHSVPFCIAAFWQVEEDNEKRGGSVELEMTDHGHFLHWDEPEAAIASWIKALS